MDDCPPQGVRRPDPGLLLEHDDYSIICADLRSFIRARVAAAKDRVSVWELPTSPPMTPRPASTVPPSGRGVSRRQRVRR